MEGVTGLRLVTPDDGIVDPPSPAVSRRARDPDHDIMSLVVRGELLAAFDALVRRHGSEIQRFCREALRDPTLAEDVRQQVFFEAYRDLSGFAGRSSVRSWLFAIARHRVMDLQKRRARQRAREDSDEEVGKVCDPGPSPVESLGTKQLHAHLVAIVAELPEATREMVLLRFHHGFTYEEMGAMYGAHPAALHARVTRALPVLRAALLDRLDRGTRPPPTNRDAKARPTALRPRSISC